MGMGQVLTKIVFFVILVLFFQNCSPYMSNTGSQLSSELGSTLSYLKCSPENPRVPDAKPLSRLNQEELRYTLGDLFEIWLTSAESSRLLNGIDDILANIPQESPVEGLAITDQSVSPVHVEQYFAMADQLALALTSDNNLFAKINSCTPINSQNCVQQFVESFGEKVYRRPLTNEDKTWYLDVYNDSSAGNAYRNLVASFLMSPFFIYHSEFGKEFVPSQTGMQSVNLGPYERASRLSYFLLRSMPDAQLFAAAKNGSIMTETGLQTQLDRLLQSETVKRRWARSFADQWLNLQETPEFDTNISAVQSMLDNLSIVETSENRRDHMIDEVVDYFYYMLWVQQADFKEFMLSDLVFPRTDDLAEIYGSEVWNGSYSENDLVRAPANQRAGVLTRAQVLFTGTHSTRPIMRGVGIYRNILCNELGLPADNTPPEGVVLEDHFTGRETVQAMTEQKGSSCVGCHKTIINPLAFPFEKYDSFGTYREQEHIYYPQNSAEQGNILTIKPVDSEVSLNMSESLQGSIDDGVALVHKLAASNKANLCFDQKVLSFAMKSNIHLQENYDCAIQEVHSDRFFRGGRLIETLRSTVLQPEFMKRTFK